MTFETDESVLCIKVSSIQECSYREVPLYTYIHLSHSQEHMMSEIERFQVIKYTNVAFGTDESVLFYRMSLIKRSSYNYMHHEWVPLSI